MTGVKTRRREENEGGRTPPFTGLNYENQPANPLSCSRISAKKKKKERVGVHRPLFPPNQIRIATRTSRRPSRRLACISGVKYPELRPLLN